MDFKVSTGKLEACLDILLALRAEILAEGRHDILVFIDKALESVHAAGAECRAVAGENRA